MRPPRLQLTLRQLMVAVLLAAGLSWYSASLWNRVYIMTTVEITTPVEGGLGSMKASYTRTHGDWFLERLGVSSGRWEVEVEVEGKAIPVSIRSGLNAAGGREVALPKQLLVDSRRRIAGLRRGEKRASSGAAQRAPSRSPWRVPASPPLRGWFPAPSGSPSRLDQKSRPICHV